MRSLAVAGLVFLLVAVTIAAEQPPLSFAVEFCAGALAATVSFDAVLFRTSGALPPVGDPRFVEVGASGGTSGVLLELAATPLAAGATVTFVGWLMGVTGKCAGLTSILAASVSELFALQAWDLDLPEWIRILAVPAITALGATIGFNLQAGALP
jgi:hypothetical protein